jgi:hypothetical protein
LGICFTLATLAVVFLPISFALRCSFEEDEDGNYGDEGKNYILHHLSMQIN